MNFKKGFTLIELLVVVAIIGILAAIVLANLNSARAKGVDAVIKGSLSNARAQAALFYDENGQVYTDVCTSPSPNGIATIISSAAEKLSVPAVVGVNSDGFFYDANGVDSGPSDTAPSVCHDSATEWAATISLKVPGNPNNGWCVDSTGASKEVVSLDVGVTACP